MPEEEPAPELIAGIDFVVPLAQFQDAGVQSVLESLHPVDTYDGYRILGIAANTAKEAGESYADALRVLSGIASYHFVPEDRAEPFHPMWTIGPERALIPSDLHPDQILVLADFASTISNLPMRARVNDVCRVRDPKNVDAGMRAVEAYVACVEAVRKGEAEFPFENKSPSCRMACDLLRRATIIASSMGWKRPQFDPLRVLISDITARAADEIDGYGFVRAATLCFDKSIWDSPTIAAHAEDLAKHPSLSQNFWLQKDLWELAARAHGDNKDEPNRNRCLIEAGETYVANADARTDSAMVQASFLNNAIQALRQIPGTAARRKELHDRMTAIQPNIADEMSVFSHSEDITEEVDAIEKFVAGKTLPEVIRILFACINSPDPATLRDEVIQESGNSISAFMPVTVSDSQGRTRFIAPGLATHGPPDEEQVRFLINRREEFRRQAAVATRINPIRRMVMANHSISIRALIPIMYVSHFVPPDHEMIFAKALVRFLGGDDMEAASLLVPQLENSLRHLLSLSGVETNKINQDGTQEERTLGALLDSYRESLEKLLPTSILQELDLLFNFRGGPSIRNEQAHGKTPDHGFFDTNVIYSTWLILKLAALPAFRMWDELSKEIHHRGGR